VARSLEYPKGYYCKKRNLPVNNYSPKRFSKMSVFNKIVIISNTSFDVILNAFFNLFFPDSIKSDLCPVIENLNSIRHIEHLHVRLCHPKVISLRVTRLKSDNRAPCSIICLVYDMENGMSTAMFKVFVVNSFTAIWLFTGTRHGKHGHPTRARLPEWPVQADVP